MLTSTVCKKVYFARARAPCGCDAWGALIHIKSDGTGADAIIADDADSSHHAPIAGRLMRMYCGLDRIR